MLRTSEDTPTREPFVDRVLVPSARKPLLTRLIVPSEQRSCCRLEGFPGHRCQRASFTTTTHTWGFAGRR